MNGVCGALKPGPVFMAQRCNGRINWASTADGILFQASTNGFEAWTVAFQASIIVVPSLDQRIRRFDRGIPSQDAVIEAWISMN